jgi:NADPH:quinone reductase-like Zn-dependent oxidoreductase
VYVKAGGRATLSALLLDPLLSMILSAMGRNKMRGFIAKVNKPDLVLLKSLLEEGKLVPVIDRSYPLSHAAEAVRYLEEGHAHGKVVLTVGQN